MCWFFADFNQGRLVLADAGRRRLLDDDQTLFTVTAQKKFESEHFGRIFCGER
jgi:hypothetical protein